MSASPMSSRRTWRPLLLLEAGTLLAGMGNGVALVVLPWLVLELTGSAAAAGAVASAQVVPLLVASLFSGTVVDMVGRRRTAIVADVLSGVSVALIPLLAAFDRLDVTWLVVLTMLGAALDPAGATAREAMLPGSATAAGWSWDRANAVHEAVYGVAFLLGPGLGGLLIAWVGAENALVATAVGFALAVLLTLFLHVEGAGRPSVEERPERVWQATKEGFFFVWHSRLLRNAMLLMCLVVAAYLPFESVVLPVYFTERGDPEMLGWVVTAMSAGGVVGSLAYPPVVRWVGRRNLFVGCVVLACTALFGLGTLPEATWALLLLAVLTGLLWGPVNPILNLAMQVLSPENMRGRVIGVVTSAAFAAGPVGLVVAGPLVDAFGVEPTSIGVGAVVLATSLVAFVLPLRGFDDLVEPAGAETHVGSVPRADVPQVGGGVPGDLDDDRRLSP
jgi:MFS family permease